MKEVFACGVMLNENLARAAVIGTGMQPEKAIMTNVQLASVCQLFETVAVESVPANLEDIEAVKRLARQYVPVTFLGMKVVIDETMPIDRVDFRNTEGELVGRISGLAIAFGFEKELEEHWKKQQDE